MNLDKQAVIDTARTRWSPSDQCFITESALAPTIIGCSAGAYDSHKVFLEMLVLNCQAIKEGKHAIYKTMKSNSLNR